MSYAFEGTFLEACDCYVVCPCWTGGGPDEGMCVGMFCWRIERGWIDHEDARIAVGRCDVAAVTTHVGRKQDLRQTVLFIDPIDEKNDKRQKAQLKALEVAYRGLLGGPLDKLKKTVFGVIVDVVETQITFEDVINLSVAAGDGVGVGERAIDQPATVRIGPRGKFVSSKSAPLVADDKGPIRLVGTKLAEEVSNEAVVRQGEQFAVRLPALGLNVNEVSRSALSGRFRYMSDPEAGREFDDHARIAPAR